MIIQYFVCFSNQPRDIRVAAATNHRILEIQSAQEPLSILFAIHKTATNICLRTDTLLGKRTLEGVLILEVIWTCAHINWTIAHSTLALLYTLPLILISDPSPD